MEASGCLRAQLSSFPAPPHAFPTTLWPDELPAVLRTLARWLHILVPRPAMPFPGSPPGGHPLVLQVQLRLWSWVRASPAVFTITFLIVLHWNQPSAHYTESCMRTGTNDLFPLHNELNKHMLSQRMSGVWGPSSDMCQKHPIDLSNVRIPYPCDSGHYRLSSLGVSTCNSDTLRSGRTCDGPGPSWRSGEQGTIHYSTGWGWSNYHNS